MFFKLFKLLAILFIGLVLVAAVGYMLMPNYYRVLIIGSDLRDTERSRSDSLMVVGIPKSSKNTINIVMVPRDTFIEHDEFGMQKITHFYALGERTDSEVLGNLDLTQEVVEELLNVKMDASVEVTFDSFIEIVDLLGGVQTDEGYKEGAEAKEMIHNRMVQAEGDFGRAENQREILQEIMKKGKSIEGAKTIYNYFQEADRARLKFNKIKSGLFGVAFLIGHQGRLSMGEVHEEVLPGYGDRIYTPAFGKELYYWILEDEGTEEIVKEYLK
ncbi:LCP family protein [Patescibacteria group bacterium]|nr:LCP family protein [Patescibacteria group bacterium]MBU1673316.1 LCP family protein [Patescibacteria group bacterium]MBU1963565.1 LCP family protein [Patescibacteria group bacterium]